MRRGGLAVAVMSVLAAVLAFSGAASAATTVGSSCAANDSLTSVSAVSLKNPPGYPLPSAIPSSGVITSWTFSVGNPITTGLYQEQLKVFAPVGTNEFKVVGESAPGIIGAGSTVFATRVPVQSGDLLGSSVIANIESKTVQGAIFCNTENPGDELALVSGDPTTGTTVPVAGIETGSQNPITVTVEPDADGDGYGDETQDQCPTDASTHEACPAPKAAPTPPPPPAPITLSASAAAKKAFVTVTLTSSAQATVTVGGSVKLGKGKTAQLPASTQIVAPGSLAKFTIPFPTKVKTALKQLPSKEKLSLTLSASAPGATATNLMVKVPGQKKAPAPSKTRSQGR
jgi:hypothetical protein